MNSNSKLYLIIFDSVFEISPAYYISKILILNKQTNKQTKQEVYIFKCNRSPK